MANPTYRELYKEFLVGVRKNKVGTIPPAEFATLYNQAVEEVVTKKLAIMELNKKVTNDLLPLFNKEISLFDQYAGFYGVDTNPVNYDILTYQILSANFIRREVSVSLVYLRSIDEDAYDKEVRCSKISENESVDLLNDVYYKPSMLKAYYKLDVTHPSGESSLQNFCFFVKKGSYKPSMLKLRLTYYMQPRIAKAIGNEDNVTSSDEVQFGREMSTEIIDTAIRMCIERNQDARVETYQNELNQKNTNQ
jgi:hypothetical protein